MKLPVTAAHVLFSACALFLVLPASAAISTYSTIPSFQSQGTIVQNTTFDSVCATYYCAPGDPYTIGGITYTSRRNVLIASDFGYGNSRTVLLNDFWSPFAGAITAGPTYDLFGFSAGMLGDTSLLNIQIVTNLNTYFYNGLVAPNVRAGMDFFGFKASAGEYFTGFRLTSSQGSGSAPAITDVQLGNTSPVPEPSFYGVLGFGVIALVFARKFSSRSVPDSQ